MEGADGNVYGAVSNSLDTLELPFYYLGLNTVPKRFVAGCLGMGAFLFFLKPEALFQKDGSPRPWSVTSHEVNSTAIPWWFYCVGTGAILATFV